MGIETANPAPAFLTRARPVILVSVPPVARSQVVTSVTTRPATSPFVVVVINFGAVIPLIKTTSLFAALRPGLPLALCFSRGWKHFMSASSLRTF
jgi:hypothetical protein